MSHLDERLARLHMLAELTEEDLGYEPPKPARVALVERLLRLADEQGQDLSEVHLFPDEGGDIDVRRDRRGHPLGGYMCSATLSPSEDAPGHFDVFGRTSATGERLPYLTVPIDEALAHLAEVTTPSTGA